MKKVISVLVILVLVSCGVKKSSDGTSKILYEVLTEQSDGGGNIKFFEIEQFEDFQAKTVFI